MEGKERKGRMDGLKVRLGRIKKGGKRGSVVDGWMDG